MQPTKFGVRREILFSRVDVSASLPALVGDASHNVAVVPKSLHGLVQLADISRSKPIVILLSM